MRSIKDKIADLKIQRRCGVRGFGLRAGLIAAMLSLSCMAATPASAFDPCTDCECVATDLNITLHGQPPEVTWDIDQQDQDTRKVITDNIDQQEAYFLDRWKTVFMPQLMLMAEHFVSMAMNQAFIISTFFDSKQELEHQQAMNKMVAEAARDYQPSVGMCVFGTTIRSLATAERRGDYTRYVMSQRSQDRQMGHRNAQGADGLHYDLRARMLQFKTRYCDTMNNGGQLNLVCGASAPVATRNADVNYNQMVDTPETLNIDFTENAAPTDTERDIFALADNLYASSLMGRLQETSFGLQQNREVILDLRSLLAKRSVAENSFYSIVGMKSLGSVNPGTAAAAGPPSIASPNTAAYMKVILSQLGISGPDADQMIGTAPSYFAQMGVLTKTAFQRPDFYADLYDTKANIERKNVAMTAIELMQNFDRWESYLRQEAMLSVWLELDLNKYHDQVTGAVDRLNVSGKRVAPMPPFRPPP